MSQARSVFSAYGVEIEYMIVDAERLDVRPFSDRLLHTPTGQPVAELVRGEMGWSNELVCHVLEVKNRQPVASLETLPAAFHREVTAINAQLAPLGAQLMPGGMHPWMDPRTEAQLWTRDQAAIYRSYDRIFDCHRHGWANLQSSQLNFSFAGDDEFARLHAAIRLALPILPALAASSPWADGRATGYMDYRLAVYRHHQRRIPASIGDCVPEPSASPADYRARVMLPMYRELAECAGQLGGDAGILQQEWLDVHGVVPRFERSAMEVRVLDAQECPLADLAVAAACAALVHRLYLRGVDEPLATAALVGIFDACIRDADQALVTDRNYLACLGFPSNTCPAGELWRWLVGVLAADGLLAPVWLAPLHFIGQHGPLARRLSAALADEPRRLRDVYRQLCLCLRDNTLYPGPD
ncbi:MAG: glutamate-cysteine ligase family protein [Bacteroidota bacterium]